VECGIALLGSEVKSLRDGKAQLQDAYAPDRQRRAVPARRAHRPVRKAALAYNHDPRRPRKLLAHRREIKKLEGETGVKGTTLIPAGDLFQERPGEGGDRRRPRQAAARQARRDPQKEMDRDLRRAMSKRG
jgi:SsrA-binding protein